ncbi:serine hydrolase domain-containing protein [Microbacterium murale]|uniref:CubicO group peptidase (Beta-lactamase class C family) n=1 Tax=Microbacterium murale TaxID=1081040 RepID=A0ABU0P3U0_9MICO|nr:serine hydrolase domain-containing protein [Microbacterium murale]MDQ0642002.1 CubicO group peptidase (beta-lactamase class C family) [Microbacterium murale]
MSDALRDLLARHVEAGTMPGAVGTLGERYEPVAVGLAAPGGQPLQTDAIFRIQSMTKAVSAVAALRLVQDGVIALDDPIATWLPELAEPRVLVHPDAPIEDSRPARRPITVRHLLTNQSGYGMMTADSPLRRAMIDAGMEAGAEPVDRGAQDWLDGLASLPLAFEPGDGWRYHHSFGILGILLGRVSDLSTQEVLDATVFTPAGMSDTGFTVPLDQAHRLPAAFRHGAAGLEQSEPAGAGFYVAPAPFDVSHAELVSTLADYHAFLRALVDGRLIDADLRDGMRSDQVDAAAKRPDSFFPGFWENMGWGHGVSVVTDGPHRGRFGWSGGLGTDFFVDPDGTICIVMTQVELDDRIFAMIGELQGLR